MGARNHPPLSEDPLPPSWHPDWPQGWCSNNRKARYCLLFSTLDINPWNVSEQILPLSSKEQAEAIELGDGRAFGKRAEGCEVCGMLRSHTKGTQERLRRGEEGWHEVEKFLGFGPQMECMGSFPKNNNDIFQHLLDYVKRLTEIMKSEKFESCAGK